MDTTNTITNSNTNFNKVVNAKDLISTYFPEVKNFDDLKEEILKKDHDGNRVYRIGLKEEDDLCILYCDDSKPDVLDGQDSEMSLIEDSFKSYILEKSTLTPICSQFNKMLYNDDAIDFFSNNRWNCQYNAEDNCKTIVQKSYEGTTLMVFYHGDKWYVSTRRCLDSGKSNWIQNSSYRQLFDEAMLGKFTFDDLNKDMCYQFILVHHLNTNIVSYETELGENYSVLFHVMTTKQKTLSEVDLCDSTVPGTNKIPVIVFDTLDYMLLNLNTVSESNIKNRKVTTEGYVVKHYIDGNLTVLKFQTKLYQDIVKIKPNNSNIHQSYLELYQKDNLNDYIKYFSKYNSEIIKRISICMKTMSKEVLNLYHCTRQKKNPQIYNLVGDQYKKMLYKLHGMYISHRKREFTNESNKVPEDTDKDDACDDIDDIVLNTNSKMTKSVNVHDVYQCLKALPSNELKQLFYERMQLINEPLEMTPFLNRECIYLVTQTTLMFS